MRSASRLGSMTVLVLLLVGSAGCGGGGGGGSAERGPVSFYYGALSATGEEGQSFRRSFGDATWHPDGTLVVEYATTEFGNAPVDARQEGVLAIDAEGLATIRVGETDVFEGYAAENGSLVVLTPNGTIGADPGIVVLVRFDARHTSAQLERLFLAGGLDWTTNPVEWVSTTSGLSFGAGGESISVPTFRNADGRVSGGIGTYHPMTEWSLADGSAAFALGFDNYRGALSHDGEFLWAAGHGARPNPISGWIGVRCMVPGSTTASTALLAGRYGFVSIRRAESGGVVNISGLLDADGLGNLTTSLTVINSDGIVIRSLAPHSLRAAVNARGECTLDWGPPRLLQGGVSPSGRHVVLGGSLNNETDPALWILTRLGG